MAKPARSRCNCFRCPTSRMSSQISIFGPAGSNFSNVAFGSITTGSSEQQFRPCPLCPESGRKLATCDMPLRVDGDAHDAISSQQPVERWHGAASRNLARIHCLIVARGGAVAPWHLEKVHQRLRTKAAEPYRAAQPRGRDHDIASPC